MITNTPWTQLRVLKKEMILATNLIFCAKNKNFTFLGSPCSGNNWTPLSKLTNTSWLTLSGAEVWGHTSTLGKPSTEKE